MFDGRDIDLWIYDEQLNARVPVIFDIDENGQLIITSSTGLAQIAQYRVNEENGTVEVDYLNGQGRAFDIKIEDWLPKFIMRDKNGRAMARAIEAGLTYMNNAVQDGIESLTNVQRMPEWALDEKAWEYNIVYDYSAPVDMKRKWIAEAFNLSALAGTAAGIVKYLVPYFDNAQVEEWWEYGADPYHFRVLIAGERTDAKDTWAQDAITRMKNVRSVLDAIIYEVHESEAELLVGSNTAGLCVKAESTTIEGS